jgi:hypothetical protein
MINEYNDVTEHLIREYIEMKRSVEEINKDIEEVKNRLNKFIIHRNIKIVLWVAAAISLLCVAHLKH